jgi:phospholipid transport system substrate-binding protein
VRTALFNGRKPIAIRLIGFVVGGWLLVNSPSLHAANSPRAVVEDFHTVLLQIMKQAEALRVQGRYDQLLPRIQQAFDLPLMIRVAAGAPWRQATPQQQTALISAFTRMSAGTYASRFTGFSGQQFVTVGERPGPRGTKLVETQIVSPGGDPVTLTYVTRANQGDWRIVDVLLTGGISELAVRRSEYRRVLAKRGAAGLIDDLNRAANRLLQGGP